MGTLVFLALILSPSAALADNRPVAAAELTPPPELVRAMDAVVDQLLTAGEADAQWQSRGIDLMARLRAAPGGVNASILASDAPGDRSVQYLGNAEVPVPEGAIELLTVHGTSMPGEIPSQDLFELEEGVWMRVRSRLTMRGHALCGRGWESLSIFVAPGKSVDEGMRFSIMAMRQVLTKLAEVEICVTSVEQPDGGLLDRAYLPDGRTLPAMDAEAKPVRLRAFSDAAAILNP